MEGFRKVVLSALVVAALALPASASADTLTFGPTFQNHSADSTATCGFPPLYLGILPLANSCTFFSTATPSGTSTEGQVVPFPDPAVYGNQSGVLDTVRIKTGPSTTGPAQITVLRATRSFSGATVTCCKAVMQGALFDLTPNTIVTVDVNLPVVSTYDATAHLYAYDLVSLSILGQSTRIPLDVTLGPNAYCSSGFLSSVVPGLNLTNFYDICGFLLLLQGDVITTTTGGGSGGGATGGGTPAAVPAPKVQTIEFPPLQPAIAGRIAKVRIKCKGKTACAGVLRLQSQPSGASMVRKTTSRQTRTYGSGRFKIAAGRRGVVRVKMNTRGKRLLRSARRAKRKKVRVYANATLGSRVFSKQLLLKTRRR